MVAEHSHVPTSRATPFPAGGELPREYYRSYDPFVALSAAALATSKLLIGPGVLLLPQRDAIHTAKAVASVDQLSTGRLLLGLGLGWNCEEAADHGVDATMRGRLLDEKLAAMKELWANEEAEFHGAPRRFRYNLLLAQARAEAASADLLRWVYFGHSIPSTTASRWLDAHGRTGRGYGPRTDETSRRCNRHPRQRHCPGSRRTRTPGRLPRARRRARVPPALHQTRIGHFPTARQHRGSHRDIQVIRPSMPAHRRLLVSIQSLRN